MDLQPLSCAAAARIQLLVAIGCLSVASVTFAGLDVAARNKRLAAAYDCVREAARRQTKEIYSHTGYFVDFEDRLLLDELPHADYSQGGVVLVGSSNLKWSTKLWELPSEQQALIHNFGMGGCNHSCQFQLLRYLIERRQLLQAGGKRTLVILGVSYHSTVLNDDIDGFFPNSWRRHGFYQYDRQRGIQDVDTHLWRRWLSTERIRVGGFLVKWRERLLTQFEQWRNDHADPAVRQLDRTELLERRRAAMGDDWQANLREQLRDFSRLIDYLHIHNVQVAVVLLPQGSWEQDLPYERDYVEQLQKVCRDRGLTPLDWSDKLADDDFADSSHFNLAGMEKLQPAILKIAIEHLRKTGALP